MKVFKLLVLSLIIFPMFYSCAQAPRRPYLQLVKDHKVIDLKNAKMAKKHEKKIEFKNRLDVHNKLTI